MFLDPIKLVERKSIIKRLCVQMKNQKLELNKFFGVNELGDYQVSAALYKVIKLRFMRHLTKKKPLLFYNMSKILECDLKVV